MVSMNLKKSQIGKCGELLVQLRLLMTGIESAHLTTDSGIDLVAYSPRKREPLTIQVKSNLKPKPGGGSGKEALDWWIPDDNPADLAAFTDLSTSRVWLMRQKEVAALAQQHSSGRFHLYMYVDPTAKPRTNNLAHVYEFEKFLLENRVHEIF